MIPDNIDPRDLGSEDDSGTLRRGRPESHRDQGEAPLSDREVPLDSLRMHPALHERPDGEVDEDYARATAGGRRVDMWGSIGDQAEVLRQRTTPLYMHKRIMDALPDQYAAALPWYKKSVKVSPVTLIVASAGAVLLGAAITALFH